MLLVYGFIFVFLGGIMKNYKIIFSFLLLSSVFVFCSDDDFFGQVATTEHTPELVGIQAESIGNSPQQQPLRRSSRAVVAYDDTGDAVGAFACASDYRSAHQMGKPAFAPSNFNHVSPEPHAQEARKSPDQPLRRSNRAVVAYSDTGDVVGAFACASDPHSATSSNCSDVAPESCAQEARKSEKLVIRIAGLVLCQKPPLFRLAPWSLRQDEGDFYQKLSRGEFVFKDEDDGREELCQQEQHVRATAERQVLVLHEYNKRTKLHQQEQDVRSAEVESANQIFASLVARAKVASSPSPSPFCSGVGRLSGLPSSVDVDQCEASFRGTPSDALALAASANRSVSASPAVN
jgi:hypothetical protein